MRMRNVVAGWIAVQKESGCRTDSNFVKYYQVSIFDLVLLPPSSTEPIKSSWVYRACRIRAGSAEPVEPELGLQSL